MRKILLTAWISYNEILIRNQHHIVFLDIENMQVSRIIELDSEATDITLSPDFNFVAYTKGTKCQGQGQGTFNAESDRLLSGEPVD